MPDQRRDMDEFWDIESLLPNRPEKVAAQHGQRHIEAVEIEVPAIDASKDVPDRGHPIPVPERAERTPFRATPIDPHRIDVIYRPNHPLVSRVSLYLWNGGFPYYENFCRTAESLFDRHGTPCAPVSFFSYMPQYDQMSRSQMAWYLHWRDRVRKGEYLPTDYSYIFLYLFEIINLPDRIPPAKGQELMCDIWVAYHKKYPLLHRYLAEWICDYSLIHQLDPPARTDIVGLEEHTTLKEFYACPTGDDSGRDAHIYLRFCCDYQYKKSKVYLADPANAALLDTHIPAAISYAIGELKKEGRVFSQTRMQKTSMHRDSFIGALCSERMKRRIEVEYCSFQRSHEIRFLIRDMVKYSENKLRSYLGVKSKLSIYGLSDEIKGLLNDYFALHLATGGHVKTQPRPEYEALYDVPHTRVDAQSAARIEQESWETTVRLVEAFSKEDAYEEAQLPVFETTSASEDASLDSLRPFTSFLSATQNGDLAKQKRIAADMGMTPDAVAEQINVAFVDFFGDILLEQDDGGHYQIIEDYKEEIRPLLND